MSPDGIITEMFYKEAKSTEKVRDSNSAKSVRKSVTDVKTQVSEMRCPSQFLLLS